MVKKNLFYLILILIIIVILLNVVFLITYYDKKNSNDKNSAKNKETKSSDDQVYNPYINPSEFSSNIDNKYFTLTPGKKMLYESKTEEGLEKIEVYVEHEKKLVFGVETISVWDRVWLNDELIEDTKDWYAQDKQGNVWYFGEESYEILDGKIVSTSGSWESGVNGAKPGIIMKSYPKIGDSYRQEYYKGEAEDMEICDGLMHRG